jgi:hypothetical protein
MNLDNIEKVKNLIAELNKVERIIKVFNVNDKCAVTTAVRGVWDLNGRTAKDSYSDIEWEAYHEFIPEIKKMFEQRKLAIEKELETL